MSTSDEEKANDNNNITASANDVEQGNEKPQINNTEPRIENETTNDNLVPVIKDNTDKSSINLDINDNAVNSSNTLTEQNGIVINQHCYSYICFYYQH